MKSSECNLPTLEKVVEDLKSEENSLREQEAKLDARVRNLRVEVEHCRQSAEQYHGTNRMLKVLMQQKQNGRIKGLYGRLVSFKILTLL